MQLELYRNGRQLAQSRPSGTSPVSVFAKAKLKQIVITSVVVANTTAGSVNYSLYLDVDGTTYDQTTALYYAVAVAANSTVLIEFLQGLPFTSNSAGNFAVQTSSGSALTFTVNGIEL